MDASQIVAGGSYRSTQLGVKLRVLAVDGDIVEYVPETSGYWPSLCSSPTRTSLAEFALHTDG